ncbi:hypothetical protein EYZ11_000329 [Aspergillus tanneri]|uniref:Uncharacterized protein n=1 Tax=Aspergillus tanneri TaxID=1220188 RepID=A0A4S3JXG0_9EURO|nr:hypothetical protein EYZ11_000329 [Aspergillus tanneri]
MEECQLYDHDFNIYLENSSQTLKILLLSPSSVDPHHKDECISLLNDFSASVSLASQGYIVAYLLSEQPFDSARYGLDGLLSLQIMYGIRIH